MGGDETFERDLPYQAAESIAWGLGRDAALRALTIDAAAILGVDKEVGSLEPGKLRESVHRQGRSARGPHRE